MTGKRQFSLAYLLLEISWVALALGISRGAVVAWMGSNSTPEAYWLSAWLISAAVLIWPIAIGGFCGRMTAGAGVGVILLWVSWLLMPEFLF
jgi:hypothetical protein